MGTLLSIWGWVKKAANWLWSRPAIIAGIVGALIGGFLIYKSTKNKVDNLKDAVEIQKSKTLVAKNTAKVEMLMESADKKAKQAEQLEKEIKNSKRRVVEISENQNVEGMTDDEIAKLFSNSGF